MRPSATLLLLGAAFVGTSLSAQETQVAAATTTAATADSAKETPKAGEKKESAGSIMSTVPTIQMQYFRPVDQRGLNRFETTKEPGVAYDGFKLQLGGAFTQQFQGLGHSNTAAPRVVNGVNANQLIQFGHGFFFGGVVVRNV